MKPGLVLILEDDPDLRRALTRFVTRRGYGVETAGTIREALALLDTGAIDLLVSDIDLPDGSGLELLEFMKTSRHDVPAIFITGLGDMALAAEAMKQGAVDFIAKPMDLETLGGAMDRAIQSVQRRTAPIGGADGLSPDTLPLEENRLVGRHPSIVELFKKIGVAAGLETPVLIRGETGTGKELVAREIHRHSRAEKPFVAMNCASLPESLLESELFGHERGAFTGAVSARKGRFELAGDGTLFLDEIGDAPPAFQVAILRALQEGEFVSVGGERRRSIGARFIAATHRPLERMVEEGSFRADLFYRIQVLELRIPPLRERRSDIPELARHILVRSAARAGRPGAELSAEALRRLLEHAWYGNVRELANALERAAVNARWEVILPEHLDLSEAGSADPSAARVAGSDASGVAPAAEPPGMLDALVRQHVEQVLERCEGNKREAARILNISPGRLYRILGRNGD